MSLIIPSNIITLLTALIAKEGLDVLFTPKKEDRVKEIESITRARQDLIENELGRDKQYISTMWSVRDNHQPEEPLHYATRAEEKHQAVVGLLSESIDKLHEARDMTSCGSCKEKITQAISVENGLLEKAKRGGDICDTDIDNVITQTSDNLQSIPKTLKKWKAIKQLTSRGELPQNASWYTLTPEQKKRVNEFSEQIQIKEWS